MHHPAVGDSLRRRWDQPWLAGSLAHPRHRGYRELGRFRVQAHCAHARHSAGAVVHWIAPQSVDIVNDYAASG